MSLSSVESLLKARNVVVDPEWSRSRMEEMASKPGDGVSARKRMRPTERALFDEWMESHLAVSALGSTESVPDSGVWKGRRVLQVEDFVNVGEAAKTRNEESAARMLKMRLTDGKKSIMALEYRMLPELKMATVVGTKLVVENVPIQLGLLMLEPCNCMVLGGRVRELIDQPVASASEPARANSSLPVVQTSHDDDAGDFEEKKTPARKTSKRPQERPARSGPPPPLLADVEDLPFEMIEIPKTSKTQNTALVDDDIPDDLLVSATESLVRNRFANNNSSSRMIDLSSSSVSSSAEQKPASRLPLSLSLSALRARAGSTT